MLLNEILGNLAYSIMHPVNNQKRIVKLMHVDFYEVNSIFLFWIWILCFSDCTRQEKLGIVIYKIAFSCNFLVFSKKVDKFKKKFDVLTQKFVIFTQKVEIFRHNLGILPKTIVNFCQKVGILRKKVGTLREI